MTELMIESPQDLVRRAQHGDRSAFERLVAFYQTRLDRAVTSRLGAELREKIEVGDVVQETVLKAPSSLKTFEWRGEDSFLRWLTGIAEHILRDQVDRQRRRRTAPLQEEIPHDDPSPSITFRRNERFVRLQVHHPPRHQTIEPNPI